MFITYWLLRRRKQHFMYMSLSFLCVYVCMHLYEKTQCLLLSRKCICMNMYAKTMSSRTKHDSSIITYKVKYVNQNDAKIAKTHGKIIKSSLYNDNNWLLFPPNSLTLQLRRKLAREHIMWWCWFITHIYGHDVEINLVNIIIFRRSNNS